MTTTIYTIGIGHNVAEEELVPFDPQPASRGIQVTRRRFAVSGGVKDEGSYIDLLFGLLDPEDVYQAVLTQCGLLVAKTALVTVGIEDENFDPVRMNGTAVKPQPGADGGRDGPFLQNFVILIKKLHAPT